MRKQNFERRNNRIRRAFRELKNDHPERLARRLNLSWSNWGFGMESLRDSAKRLSKNGLLHIELHGNHYGPDLGYRLQETKCILADFGLTVGGMCGMFSAENDLSSNSGLDFIKSQSPVMNLEIIHSRFWYSISFRHPSNPQGKCISN